MREILFRGKSQHSNEWLYGSLLLTDDNKNNCFGTGIIRQRHQIVHYNAGDWNMGQWVAEDIYQASIGQYTGLKDKNGIKIFEGDIIEFKDSFEDIFADKPEVVRREVVFDTEQLWFHPRDSSVILHRQFNEDFTVIGNIHDNPKLINK